MYTYSVFIILKKNHVIHNKKLYNSKTFYQKKNQKYIPVLFFQNLLFFLINFD